MLILYTYPEPLPISQARSIQVVKSCTALARTGVQVILAYVPSEDDSTPLSYYGIDKPESLKYLPLNRTLPSPLSFLGVKSTKIFYSNLKNTLSTEKIEPDIIICRHTKLAKMLINGIPEIPLIYEAHEVFSLSAPSRKKSQKLLSIEDYVLNRSTLIISNSKETADSLKEKYKLTKNLHVLHNGVDTPPKWSEKSWDTAKNQITYCGSLQNWKGVDTLIEACAYLPGYQVTIIGGNANQISELKSTIKPSGAKINFIGHVSHKQAMQMLSDSCIAILPNKPMIESQWTSPIKLFEYMSIGCSIIASDLPSIREVVTEEEVTFFTPGSPRELAKAIEQLCSNPKLMRELAFNAHNKSHEFTWENRANKLLDIIKNKVFS